MTDTTTRDDSGEVAEAGDVGVFRLEDGDCLLNLGDLGFEAEEVGGFEAVPCEDEHDGEVIYIDDDFFAGRSEFPGLDSALEEGHQACVPVLEDLTQVSYEESPYDAIPLVPTSESWAELNDRELICIGVTLNSDFTDVVTTTGSIEAG